MTQLQSFVRFLRAGVGVEVDPDLIRDLKPDGESAERPSFPHDELRTLFSDEEWTGDAVVHDRTYLGPDHLSLLGRTRGGALRTAD